MKFLFIFIFLFFLLYKVYVGEASLNKIYCMTQSHKNKKCSDTIKTHPPHPTPLQIMDTNYNSNST